MSQLPDGQLIILKSHVYCLHFHTNLSHHIDLQQQLTWTSCEAIAVSDRLHKSIQDKYEWSCDFTLIVMGRKIHSGA